MRMLATVCYHLLLFATLRCCSGLERNEALKECLTFCLLCHHWRDTVLLSEEQPGLDSSLMGDDRGCVPLYASTCQNGRRVLCFVR